MKEKWPIDGEQLFEFLSDQLVKESGAFSKGVNKGLNIARSAIHNIDAVKPIDIETLPLVKELRKRIEELEDQNRRLAYESLTLRDNAMYFEKRFYESALNYENAMNQLQKYIAEMDSNKSNRYVIVDPEAIDLAMKLTKVTEERDVAIEQLRGFCFACKHYTPYHNDGLCATCTHERACYKPWEATDKWEWKGLTENENEE